MFIVSENLQSEYFCQFSLISVCLLAFEKNTDEGCHSAYKEQDSEENSYTSQQYSTKMGIRLVIK